VHKHLNYCPFHNIHETKHQETETGKIFDIYLFLEPGRILKKMKIPDRINMIYRIRINPVYPVNPVKRFDRNE
jgi:hypothetical protein